MCPLALNGWSRSCIGQPNLYWISFILRRCDTKKNVPNLILLQVVVICEHVAMVTYWCILLLGFSALLLALITQLSLREDEKNPGRITLIHCLVVCNEP